MLKKKTPILLSLLSIGLFPIVVKAQDPHFTQFFSSPLIVNPANTGYFKDNYLEDGKLRATALFRNQWISFANPYRTAGLSIDAKVNTDIENVFSLGTMFFNDNSMNGVIKSNYFGLTGSYHRALDEDASAYVGIGFSGVYGNRLIDFPQLTFGNQFDGLGFDPSLPSGELPLQNMKPFISGGVGLLFQSRNSEDGLYIDAGLSCYNFNKPKQTLYDDKNQYLPPRFSGQVNVSKNLSNINGSLSLKTIYQMQAATNYFAGAIIFDKYIQEGAYKVSLGALYRTNDAFAPVLGLQIQNFRIESSYDITHSTLKNSGDNMKSMEFALTYIISNTEQ